MLPAEIGSTASLPALVERAASTLASAKTAAEVLDAAEMASVAYDVAKRAARLARAKSAHDELIQKVYRAQADALDIEARAKRRLADEYDAAQERGEAARAGDNQHNKEVVPNANDLGLSRKDIHEARIIRDAEQSDPGIVRRTVDAAVSNNEEPTKASVRRAVLRAARPDTEQQQARPTRGKTAVRARVRDAIVALAGLPPAQEVAAYFDGTDEAIVISDHLVRVTSWLNEFSQSWGQTNALDAE